MSIAKIEQVIHNVWKRAPNSKLIIFDTLVAFGLAFFTLNVNRSRFLGHDFNWDLLNYHLSNEIASSLQGIKTAIELFDATDSSLLISYSFAVDYAEFIPNFTF